MSHTNQTNIDVLLVYDCFNKCFYFVNISILCTIAQKTPSLISFALYRTMLALTNRCLKYWKGKIRGKVGHLFMFCWEILDDCLEMSCLLLAFHKCDSQNNEIHKKPILYECKLWLLIKKTIKPLLYRYLGPCLLFSWEACFACGTIFDLRLQDIM